jgi:hypothetical protein
MESQRSFVDYMTKQNWTVRIAPTEAEMAIAIDANPGDIGKSRTNPLTI